MKKLVILFTVLISIPGCKTYTFQEVSPRSPHATIEVEESHTYGLNEIMEGRNVAILRINSRVQDNWRILWAKRRIPTGHTTLFCKARRSETEISHGLLSFIAEEGVDYIVTFRDSPSKEGFVVFKVYRKDTEEILFETEEPITKVPPPPTPIFINI